MATYKSYYDDTTFPNEGAREAYDALKDAWQVRYGNFDTLNEAYYARTGKTWRESKGGPRLQSEIPVSDGGTFGAEGNIPGSELLQNSGGGSGTVTPDDLAAYYKKFPKKYQDLNIDPTDATAIAAISRVIEEEPDNALAKQHLNDIITKGGYTQPQIDAILENYSERVANAVEFQSANRPARAYNQTGTTSGVNESYQTSTTGTQAAATQNTTGTAQSTTSGTTESLSSPTVSNAPEPRSAKEILTCSAPMSL